MSCIDHIKSLINGLEAIQHPYPEEEIDALERRSEMMIARSFGEESRYLKDLRQICDSAYGFFLDQSPDYYEKLRIQRWEEKRSKLANLFQVMLEDCELLTGASNVKNPQGDGVLSAILHPVITKESQATFLLGEYNTAVFQAFRALEVTVRNAGGFDASVIGTDLMRKAFKVPDGPLTDPNLVPAEQQAMSDLFAGAIGSYKNSHSHRILPVKKEEAVEMLVLASHLLRIVDARSANS